MAKGCKRCEVSKGYENFRPDPRYKDGFGSWCRDCHKERGSQWARENRKANNQKASEWRAKNKQKLKEINRRSKVKRKKVDAELRLAWGRKNQERVRFFSMRRKAQKVQATPVWADEEAIAQIYWEATYIQALTGVKMHVDHIVPLQHEDVCGLHCEANLRVITATENISKKNYWWPDMPTKAPEPKQEPLL